MWTSKDDDGVGGAIPLTTLYRWFLYDIDDQPSDYLDVFDIAPVSAEGDEKERDDSNERLNRVDPILPFLELYGLMAAEYAFAAQKAVLMKDPNPAAKLFLEKASADEDTLVASYERIVMSGIVGAFSTAVELGIIKLNDTVTQIGTLDNE